MGHEFVDWCSELLAPLGRVRTRRMFGAHGLYVDEVFIAIVSGERLYLKVDDETRARFEAAGCQRFEYTTTQGVVGSLNYFTAPDEALDSPDQLQPWARLAMDSALRAKLLKAPAPARKPSASRRQSAEAKARQKRQSTR